MVGVLLVIIVAVVALVLEAAHSASAISADTRASALSAGRRAYGQESCLRASIRRQVQKNSPVFIDATGQNYQFLSQYLTLWAEPVGSRAAASVTVSLVPSTRACAGEALRVLSDR